MRDLPLIVIVGPTASGKTSLAIDIAKQFGGEIICADSRTVYIGMDIGTAKPSRAEQAMVPHWALDLVEPGQRFTAADFKEYANKKIAEIRSRGNIPMIVGGTGLYVDGVIFDYKFGDDVNTTQREKLDEMSLEQLHKYCEKNNVELPENKQNKRYVIRAIEQKSINVKRRDQPIDNTIVVGISTESEELRTRISARTEQLFANGVVEEAKMLGKKYGWENEAMTGNIYPIARQLLNGEISENEAKSKFTTQDWHLAKRQLTWFKRRQSIVWLSLLDAKRYLQKVLTVV